MLIRLAHIKKGNYPDIWARIKPWFFFLGTATSGLILAELWRGIKRQAKRVNITYLFYVKFACANYFEYSRMISDNTKKINAKFPCVSKSAT